jgi:hypothetical protein
MNGDPEPEYSPHNIQLPLAPEYPAQVDRRW